MIKVDNGWLVEDVSELPNLFGDDLFLDLETTSGSPDLDSKNPWHNCKIAGIGVCSGRGDAYYIPVRHNSPYTHKNLPIDVVRRWLVDVLKNHKRWKNHNIKYDAHVLWNDLKLEFDGPLICTINARAKLWDSERVYKGGYVLEVLADQLLGKNILKYKNALQPYLEHSKDYGDIDPLVMAPYGCTDVVTVRDLDDYLPYNGPIEDLEIKVTSALIEMERAGMRIQPVDVDHESLRAEIRMLEIQNILHRKYGYFVNPSSNDHMHDILCVVHGLPVLHYTNEDDDDKPSNPSFNKYALKDYLSLVDAPTEFIKLAEEYRELKTFNSLFLKTYQEKHVHGLLHPTYNQIVRTGRMSCGEPNMQQLSKRAKNLILPNNEGWGIFRADYSQIEQRIITYYVNDAKVIGQYLDNPDVDAYLALANKVGCTRQPAKTIALGSGYGMGVRKLVAQLSAIEEVVDFVRKYGSADLQRSVKLHARKIYDQFHREYPKLKPTTKRAEKTCKQTGYVTTLMGRRRHLGIEWARKAFNAACQGSAADLIKLKVVQFHELLKGTPVKLLAQVHDELVFAGPKEITGSLRFQRDIMCLMEENPLPMQIPIRVSGGYSEVSWATASSKKSEFKIPPGLKGERLEWLKSA